MPSITNPLREIKYSDIDINLTPHPVTGLLKVLKNEDAIKGAVKNLVLTNRGEIPYNSNIGSDIYASLFENFTPLTEITLRHNIEIVLQNYEPRATLLKTIFSIDEDHNIMTISIVFQPVNASFPVTVQVFIERIR